MRFENIEVDALFQHQDPFSQTWRTFRKIDDHTARFSTVHGEDGNIPLPFEPFESVRPVPCPEVRP